MAKKKPKAQQPDPRSFIARATGAVSAAVGTVTGAAGATAKSVTETVSDTAEDVVEAVVEKAEDVVEAVRENPGTAMGAAFAAAALGAAVMGAPKVLEAIRGEPFQIDPTQEPKHNPHAPNSARAQRLRARLAKNAAKRAKNKAKAA